MPVSHPGRRWHPAAIESWWRMDNKGDWGTDASRCPANHGPGMDGKPGTCPQSYGMLQVRYPCNKRRSRPRRGPPR
jgi:hypothetical protein